MRKIRLKEWGACADITKRPNEKQLHGSDGSLEDREFRLRTNSEGFITSGIENHSNATRQKLICLGGSFVESLYVREPDRFLAQWERRLHLAGIHAQVWNGGRSGATLLHSFNVFVNKVLPIMEPDDQVLIFTAMSDMKTLKQNDSYWAPDSVYSPLADPRHSMVPDDRAPSTRDHEMLLSAFIEFARSYGIEPIIVTSPYRRSTYDFDPYLRSLYEDESQFQQDQSLKSMINMSARKVAEATCSTLFDAEAEFLESPGCFYDELHLNVLGQNKMATYLERQYVSSSSDISTI